MRDIFLENTTIAFYFMAEQKEQTRATYNNNKKKKYENVSTFFGNICVTVTEFPCITFLEWHGPRWKNEENYIKKKVPILLIPSRDKGD